MKNIEVEIRSFIDEAKYKELISRLKREAEFLGEDEQVTYYFDSKEDLRIQKNNSFAKIWLKKGAMHDDGREELEVRFAREDFDKLEQIFLTLGYKVEIKWFRTRNSFKWGDIDVAVDYTKGYGHIIELEQMAEEDEKDRVLTMLKEKMAELGVDPTPKEEFDKAYQHYKEHWQELV